MTLELADVYFRREATTMDQLGFNVCLILAAQVLRRRWRHFTTALCHFLFSNSSLSLLQILQECHFDDNKKNRGKGICVKKSSLFCFLLFSLLSRRQNVAVR